MMKYVRTGVKGDKIKYSQGPKGSKLKKLTSSFHFQAREITIIHDIILQKQ